ncbi:MAG: guanylate kinase [Deltaproteobacteria bacterium]|nr:MAG: guanylate kinase [Deltaproteobacteria bacterium]
MRSTSNIDPEVADGRLFVVSAPSGAGKTTLCHAARRQLPQLVYSTSSTTRPPRDGERDGLDYFFVSESRFKQGIDNGEWAEWARVHDNYYGTSADFIQRHLDAGRDVLLDIDVQGAAQLLERYPDAVTIFIMAPSLDDLHRRLIARGQDSDAVIETRMRNAEAEIAGRHMYRHVVVNDVLETAIAQFVAILKGRGRV